MTYLRFYWRFFRLWLLDRASRRALGRGDKVKAESGCREIVQLERLLVGMTSAPLPAGRVELCRRIYCRTHLTLGQLLLGRGAREEAFEPFARAAELGGELPAEAVALVAETYAEREERRPEALDAYLAFLALRPGGAQKVYKVLQTACAVDETSSAEARKGAVDLNGKVVAARPDIEWAHYYLGLALLLEGRRAPALESFLRALALNRGRALTHYWIGICRLGPPTPDLEGAVESLSKFLSASSPNPKFIQRQQKAALELGKRLLAASGGSMDRRALGFLEYAVAKPGPGAAAWFYTGHARSLAGDSAGALTAFEAAARLAALRPSSDPACALPHCLYRLGGEQRRAGLLREAQASLAKATGLDPGHAEAHRELAGVCLQLEDFSSAEVHARELLRLSGWRVENARLLIRALYYLGKYEELLKAQREIDDYCWRPPESEEDYELEFCQARSLAKVGRYKEAIFRYQYAGESARTFYYLGCALAHDGNYDQASQCFERVIGEGGAYAACALRELGHILLRKGELEAAESCYHKVEGELANDTELRYAMGCLRYRAGHLDQAAECFSRLESQDTRARFALGLVEEGRGRYAEAIAHYQAVPGTASDVRIGVLHSRRRQYASAREHLEKAYGGGNQEDAVLFYLGSTLLSRDGVAEAIDLWGRLQQRHPEDERLADNLCCARYLLGVRHASHGKYAEALAEWEPYLNRFPEDTKAAQSAAELGFAQAIQQLRMRRDGYLQDASATLAAAIRRDASQPVYPYLLALCELSLGRYDESLARLEELATAGDDPKVVYHLGLCRLRKGQTEVALQMLSDLARQEDGAGYSRLAALAVANEHIRRGEYPAAAAVLMAASGTRGS